jgi:hypothetical protein
VGHSAGLRGGVGSIFFSEAVNLSNSVGSERMVATYGDYPREAYVDRCKKRTYCVYQVSPVGCTSIRIAVTLEYE